MRFEETLAILHCWLGAELEVAIRTKEGRVVANVAGRLAAGSDLSARGHGGPQRRSLTGRTLRSTASSASISSASPSRLASSPETASPA